MIKMVVKLAYDIMMVTALSIGVLSMAYAQENTIDQELNVGMCMIATQGVYTAAIERQAGSQKSDAQKLLKKELKTVAQNFSNDNFIAFIENAWSNGLEIVYGMPIMTTPEDKETFVYEVTQAALVSCLNDLES